jgi:hypothetical protein
MNSLWVLGTFAAAGYALLCGWLFFAQERLMYFPTREIEATPAQIGLAFQRQEFRAEDGVRLTGWYVPAERPRGVLLFFHGNAGNISHRLQSIAIFHRLRLDVFIFDYRGYGESEGEAGEEGTYRDGEAAWRHLVERLGADPKQIVYFGRSLGGAVATRVAERHPPRALILESTFSSAPDLGADLYPWLPVRLLARIRYDTCARLAAIANPVLVVHSPDDEIIPFHHAERLYEAARGPKEMLRLRGDHNGGFLLTGEAYVAGFDAFLKRTGFE